MRVFVECSPLLRQDETERSSRWISLDVSATVNQNATMADEVATFGSCAKCGSQRYTQKRIWREAKAEFDGSGE